MSEFDNNNSNNPESVNELTIRTLSPLTGIKWVGESFNLFFKNPSIWIVVLILYFAISFLLASIPLLFLLPTILAPVFNAGFIYGSRQLDTDNMLEIDHLFAGFKLQFRNLFRLGLLYFVVNLIIIFIVSKILESLVSSEATLAMQSAISRQEMEQLFIQYPELIPALLKALLAAVFLSVPLVMAGWMAPALVLFNGVQPLQAMILSIKACNKNMLAFLLYGLLTLPLLLLALVPFGLGLLIMIPVVFISQYVTYKSIFEQQQSNASVFIV